MDNFRATSGIDLHLDLHGPHRRRALESALRQAILDGRLTVDAKLPSSRSLAVDLGLARNTVVDAYAQLVAEGWLTARQGSGTTVADRNEPPHVGTGVPLIAPAAWRYDLRPGRPDLSSFPRNRWLSAARKALSYVPDADLGCGDPRGTRQLRETLSGYLGRVRGVRADPDRLIICTGFTQAFALLTHVLRQHGATTVAVERYGLPDLRQIAIGAGLEVSTLPVDDNGADFTTAAGAGAAVITPAHQFPLGTVLSPTRRRAALAWAQAHKSLIIEDDYDGEFRYDREPLGALQGLDPELVVYVGTTSKTLAPGLRLAWMVAPANLVEQITRAKRLADRHTSIPDQLTLAEFIRSGAYDRHVRRRRLVYRQRRDELVSTFGAKQVEGISAGLHAVVNLPTGLSESDAIANAAASGLAVEGLDTYLTGPNGHPPALVVGYAAPPDHAYRATLTVLQKAIQRRP